MNTGRVRSRHARRALDLRRGPFMLLMDSGEYGARASLHIGPIVFGAERDFAFASEHSTMTEIHTMLLTRRYFSLRVRW